jgi:hypothetical protein
LGGESVIDLGLSCPWPCALHPAPDSHPRSVVFTPHVQGDICSGRDAHRL